MTPDLPQVQCAAAEPGASGRTGHWAQKQPLLFSSAQLQVCLVLFHECCAQKLLLLMCQQQSDFLKQGFDWGGGEWSGRRRFITPSCFSIGLLLEGKQGQLVLPSSAVFLIHRNNKASDLLPCHCRLTQRIIWMQWLGENSSLYSKEPWHSLLGGSLWVGTAWHTEVCEMLGVCAGAANTVTGIIYAWQGKEPCLVSSCLFRAGLFKSPVTEKHRPQF